MIWHRDKILIVQKSYKKGWSIPGGILKRGETWQQAAVRETFEEVGIHLEEKALVFIKEVPGDLGPCDRARMFEVQMESPPTVKIDEREIVNAQFVTPDEAMQRDLYQHVKTYLWSQNKKSLENIDP